MGDLVGYGTQGLLWSIERFDPGRGIQFQTFAQRRIVGAMRDGLRLEDHISRLSRARARRRPGTAPEAAPPAAPFTAPNLAIPDDFEPSQSSDEDFWREHLRGLNRQERLLLLLYYVEAQTMKAIGRTLGLSESRVSQMHSDLIRRLRARIEGAEKKGRPSLRPQAGQGGA